MEIVFIATHFVMLCSLIVISWAVFCPDMKEKHKIEKRYPVKKPDTSSAMPAQRQAPRSPRKIIIPSFKISFKNEPSNTNR